MSRLSLVKGAHWISSNSSFVQLCCRRVGGAITKGGAIEKNEEFELIQ